MNAGREIGRAFAAIENERVEDEQRAKYQRAMKVLRDIPSGTADADLTPEQRQAWADADAWHEYLDDSALEENDMDERIVQ